MNQKPANGAPAVPSRDALRVLRRLALAGSTVGSFCTIAALTYDVHRRVSVAERIVENKRALQTSAPNYDATSAARRLSRMMEAAEAGEFNSLQAWQEEERQLRKAQAFQTGLNTNGAFDENSLAIPTESTENPTADNFSSITTQPREAKDLDSKQNLPTPLERKQVFPGLPQPTPIAVTQSKYIIRRFAPSSNTTAMEGKSETSGRKQDALVDEMQKHLDHHRPIDAAQIFLDAHPASLKGISSSRKTLAVRTFYVNCNEGNVYIARTIFERLEEVDKISPTMWKILMASLAKNGAVESVATLYTRYMQRFPVPAKLVDIVVRSLIESRRLTTAKWVLLRNLSVDLNCGLCGAYLAGLWKKTRSIELLNGQFKKLLTKVLPRLEKRPTTKLFNPVISAYVESGRVSDAEALVHEMTTTYGIPLGCRTKGLLVYGKALSCDWKAVNDGLEEMYELGLTKQKHDFTAIFDRIFNEYWVSHAGVEIWDFVYRYIDRFDIVPDEVLYKHILESLVEKGDEAMISEFTSMARQRGWKVDFNEKEYLDLLRVRRLALDDSPVGFWRMLQEAREGRGRAAISQRLVGYDHRSFPVDTAHPIPGSQSPLSWHTRSMQHITTSRPVDQYQKLSKQMTHYIHAGHLTMALKCFQNAKNAGLHMKQYHLELAVIATLLQDGLGAARALIDAEWNTWRQRTQVLPIFFHQIMEVDSSAEAEIVKVAILHFYRLCWETRDMTIKHHLTVAMSRRLIATQQPEMALDVLVTVYMSRYTRILEFDSVCLKMFVRAFAAVNNTAGIRWCILTALARGSALSQPFIAEVRRVLGIFRRDTTTASLSPSEASKRRQKLKYLTKVTRLLQQKYDGNPEVSGLGCKLEAKKSSRRMEKQPFVEDKLYYHPHISKVSKRVEPWDEEYELEAVLGRIDMDPESILARWNEESCLGRESIEIS